MPQSARIRFARLQWYGLAAITISITAYFVHAAQILRPIEYCHWLIPCFGIPIGVWSGYTAASSFCADNIRRIRQLHDSNSCLCYPRPIVIAAMTLIFIIAILMLSTRNNYWFLCANATFGNTVTATLLTGGRMFWRNSAHSS